MTSYANTSTIRRSPATPAPCTKRGSTVDSNSIVWVRSSWGFMRLGSRRSDFFPRPAGLYGFDTHPEPRLEGGGIEDVLDEVRGQRSDARQPLHGPPAFLHLLHALDGHENVRDLAAAEGTDDSVRERVCEARGSAIIALPGNIFDEEGSLDSTWAEPGNHRTPTAFDEVSRPPLRGPYRHAQLPCDCG